MVRMNTTNFWFDKNSTNMKNVSVVYACSICIMYTPVWRRNCSHIFSFATIAKCSVNHQRECGIFLCRSDFISCGARPIKTTNVMRYHFCLLNGGLKMNERKLQLQRLKWESFYSIFNCTMHNRKKCVLCKKVYLFILIVRNEKVLRISLNGMHQLAKETKMPLIPISKYTQFHVSFSVAPFVFLFMLSVVSCNWLTYVALAIRWTRPIDNIPT